MAVVILAFYLKNFTLNRLLLEMFFYFIVFSSNICSLPLKPQNRIFIIEIDQKYLAEHSLFKQNCVVAKNFSCIY